MQGGAFSSGNFEGSDGREVVNGLMKGWNDKRACFCVCVNQGSMVANSQVKPSREQPK